MEVGSLPGVAGDGVVRSSNSIGIKSSLHHILIVVTL